MSEYDIKTISGDSFELNIVYRNSDRVPIDLTDYEVYFQARKSKESEDIDFDKTFTILVEDGLVGKIKFTLTPQETEILNMSYPSTKYIYALRITSSDGSDVKTILNGTLEVLWGVI